MHMRSRRIIQIPQATSADDTLPAKPPPSPGPARGPYTARLSPVIRRVSRRQNFLGRRRGQILAVSNRAVGDLAAMHVEPRAQMRILDQGAGALPGQRKAERQRGIVERV